MTGGSAPHMGSWSPVVSLEPKPPAIKMIGPAFHRSDGFPRTKSASLFPGTHSGLLDLMAELLAAMRPDECRPETLPDHKARIATHLRHCLVTYRAFLDGLETRRIDYGNTPKAAGDGSCPDVFDQVLELHIRMTHEAAHLPPSTRLMIRHHDGEWLESSVARESAHLEDHSLHHCMWIAMILENGRHPLPQALMDLAGIEKITDPGK